MELAIGDKYFKHDGTNVDLVRIHSIKNDKILVLLRGINKKKVELDFLQKNGYIRLKPDGFLSVNLVRMGSDESQGHDVVITLNRREDIENDKGVPFATCRQNITDFLATSINRNPKFSFIGLSLCMDTCPEDVPYPTILACGGIEYYEKISIYKDDKLNILMSMIKDMDRFNRILYVMYKGLKDSDIVGSCKTVYELLEQNAFMDDFYRSFNITPYNKILKVNDGYIDITQVQDIENIIKCRMSKVYAIKYSREIDFSKIERDYFLLSDKLSNMYIIFYDKLGYVNRVYDAFEDKKEIITLSKHINK